MSKKSITTDYAASAIPTPTRLRRGLPEAPPPERAADNMKAERLVGMTFNMPRDWHVEFKMTAAREGISMKELLEQAFAAWQREKTAR